MIILQQTRGNLSSGDQLSLDLPFAATKSLTARVGPTPSFTRASGATYIGSDGLIHGVDTSTTSNTIGTGSRTFTLTATAGQDQLWRTGDAVDASNGSNSMVGTVTSYTAATQVLVCNMTTTSGSGTFTSWRIGYRGPRFDHTSAGVCRGLLIEESRTNLVRQSGGLSTSPWSAQSGASLSAGFASPDGSTNGVQISGVSGSRTTQGAISLTSGQVYTLSVFLKQGTATLGRVSLFDGSNFFVSTFTWSTLTASVSSGSLSYTSITTDFGNGWYRVTFTFTSTATASNADFAVGLNSTGTILAWGAQLEADSFATSYIPTTTGSVVRSADVCSITGSDFNGFYNQSEGTMLSNAFTPASGDRTVLAADDNTANEMIRHRTEGTNPFFKVTDGGSDVVAIDAGTVTANTAFKLIGAYKVNDFASSINGGSAVTDTTGTIPTVDRMRIGAGQGGNPMCGCVASLRYYKKRLPDAKLQALTV
jgi:hypothetical protein